MIWKTDISAVTGKSQKKSKRLFKNSFPCFDGMADHVQVKETMEKGKLVSLDRPARLLKKVQLYLNDMDAFLADTSAAVTVLLDGLPFADRDLLLKMIPLLGYAGKDRVLWPLFGLIIEASTDEGVRRSAAVHLGLAASFSVDPSGLGKKLAESLNHRDPSVRSSCALAIGWEGNASAVEPLMARLPDPDMEFQTAVVTALASIGDRSVFDRLTDRLQDGLREEQRCILLNLWRFSDTVPQVEAVYLDWVDAFLPETRLDALSGLAMISLNPTILKVYRRLLTDENPRIRLQVLENLSAANPNDYQPLKERLAQLVTDTDARVRRAAIRLFVSV